MVNWKGQPSKYARLKLWATGRRKETIDLLSEKRVGKKEILEIQKLHNLNQKLYTEEKQEDKLLATLQDHLVSVVRLGPAAAAARDQALGELSLLINFELNTEAQTQFVATNMRFLATLEHSEFKIDGTGKLDDVKAHAALQRIHVAAGGTGNLDVTTAKVTSFKNKITALLVKKQNLTNRLMTIENDLASLTQSFSRYMSFLREEIAHGQLLRAIDIISQRLKPLIKEREIITNKQNVIYSELQQLDVNLIADENYIYRLVRP